MLQAGVSLSRSLIILEKQTKNNRLKNIINSLSKEIGRGKTLGDALANFPTIFSSLFVSMVRVGEESGSLSKTLTEISMHLKKSYELNKRIKGALVYPIIIVIAMIIIGITMFIYVVPTLAGTFLELGIELPTSTQLIISISNMMVNHTLIVLLCLFAIVVFIIFLFKNRLMQPYIDWIIIHLPVIGTLSKETNTARTARTLSSLLSAGVDMSKSLMVTKDVLGNIYYKNILNSAVKRVQKGIPLSVVFKDYPKLYPIMASEMVEVGEETGNLAKMFLDIADFYESEVDSKTKNLSTIIEPVLMIIIGAAVGFFAISMITPLYGLLGSIN